MWLYLIISARTKRYVGFMLSYRRGKKGGGKAERDQIALQQDSTYLLLIGKRRLHGGTGVTGLPGVVGQKGRTGQEKVVFGEGQSFVKEKTQQITPGKTS